MSTTTHRHAAPWTFRRFLAELFTPPTPRRRSPRPGMDHVLTAREAVARHLYGEWVNWSDLHMAEYDNNPIWRDNWLIVADRRIEHAKSSDRHVAAHHGYTPEAWHALSTLAKVDLRESFYEGQGWRK